MGGGGGRKVKEGGRREIKKEKDFIYRSYIDLARAKERVPVNKFIIYFKQLTYNYCKESIWI